MVAVPTKTVTFDEAMEILGPYALPLIRLADELEVHFDYAELMAWLRRKEARRAAMRAKLDDDQEVEDSETF